jgi:hypothetical protein
VDPDYYQSLRWLLENDITNMFDDQTFTIDVHVFGEVQTIELKPGGRHITLNNENKSEYVQLAIQWRLERAIEEQMTAIKRGFYRIIPVFLLRDFDERELELLLSGVSVIDVANWKENTEYRGYTKDSKIIQWFWTIVENYDHALRAKLLQFVTGTSRVPPEGFQGLVGSSGKQKFTISRVTGGTYLLPRAHTW